MRNYMDDLLKKAMTPDMEPSAELNEKILSSTVSKKKKSKLSAITKVAAVVLGVALATPVVAYATEQVVEYVREYKKVNDTYVADDAVAMGNPDYMVPEDTSTTEESVTSTVVEEVEGTANDKWLRKKEKQLSNSVKNTFYYYADYKTAAEDSGLDNWFSVEYETSYNSYFGGDISHCVVDAGDHFYYDINGSLVYNDGFFYVAEGKYVGNVAEDYASIIPTHSSKNAREYVNKAGATFVLVDDTDTKNDGTEVTYTVVAIRYGMYSGHIDFYNLSEQEIHEVLDTLTIRNDSYGDDEAEEESAEDTTEAATEEPAEEATEEATEESAEETTEVTTETTTEAN